MQRLSSSEQPWLHHLLLAPLLPGKRQSSCSVADLISNNKKKQVTYSQGVGKAFLMDSWRINFYKGCEAFESLIGSKSRRSLATNILLSMTYQAGAMM